MLGKPKDKKTRERQRVAGSFSKSALRSRRFNYSLESLPILDITLMLLEQRVEKREAGLNRLYENFVDIWTGIVGIFEGYGDSLRSFDHLFFRSVDSR